MIALAIVEIRLMGDAHLVERDRFNVYLGAFDEHIKLARGLTIAAMIHIECGFEIICRRHATNLSRGNDLGILRSVGFLKQNGQHG
jgi:hypothetical protein